MSVRVVVLGVLTFFLSILAACSKLGGGGDNADDGNSPYVIFDLGISAISDSSVTLKWTATGDDSSAGTASQYDMRISKESIESDIDWNEATQLASEPVPSPSGQTDSMTITGLMEDSTYYFALKACDEAGNCSGRSNCVRATCFENFIVTFPDTGLEAAVRSQISMPTGDIHRMDVMNMIFLEANGKGITSLTGLEYCTSLQGILLNGNPQLSDLSPISGLTGLIGIQFTGDNITDVSPFANLTHLEAFSLRATPLSNITPLTGLPNLQLMELSQTQITSLAPLVANSGIATGDTLYLYHNPQLAPDSINIRTLEDRGVTILR